MASSYQAGCVLSPPPVHQVVTSFRAVLLVIELSLTAVLLIRRGVHFRKFYIGITANTVGYTADERTQIFYEVRRIRTSTETFLNYNSNSDENVIPPLCFIFKAEIH